jgi:hypothetical protein
MSRHAKITRLIEEAAAILAVRHPATVRQTPVERVVVRHHRWND